MTYQWFQREMALFVSAALALISAGCSAGAQMPVGNQTGTAAGSSISLTAQAQNYTVPSDITPGTQTRRGFLNDNILHTSDLEHLTKPDK